MNKVDEIRSTLSDAKRPVIFGITETWLDPTISEGELAIPSYEIHRRDRNSTNRGGGVLLYVSEDCKSKRRMDLEDGSVEVVWVELRLSKKSFLVGNMYRPPNGVATILDKLEDMLERAASENKRVILMGDLNINLLVPSGLASRLLLTTSDNNLRQLITEPTRITEHSQTLIDVFFTSSADLFSASGTTAFTRSDHLMIFAECVEDLNAQSKVTTVRCFKKCDTDELTLDLMNAPWQVMDIYTFDTVDDMWDY